MDLVISRVFIFFEDEHDRMEKITQLYRAVCTSPRTALSGTMDLNVIGRTECI